MFVQYLRSRIRPNPLGVEVEYSDWPPSHYGVQSPGYYFIDDYSRAQGDGTLETAYRLLAEVEAANR